MIKFLLVVGLSAGTFTTEEIPEQIHFDTMEQCEEAGEAFIQSNVQSEGAYYLCGQTTTLNI